MQQLQRISQRSPCFCVPATPWRALRAAPQHDHASQPLRPLGAPAPAASAAEAPPHGGKQQGSAHAPASAWPMAQHLALPKGSDPIFQDTLVHTRFHWPVVPGAPGDVHLWGSFNGWTRGVKLHRASAEAEACVILPLRPGNYEFKFVVDNVWMPAPHEPTAINSEGALNNFRVVAPTVTFRLRAPGAKQVLVVGGWDDFQYAIVMRREAGDDDHFTAPAHLPPGCYPYAFVVDERVTLDAALPAFPEAKWRGGQVHKVWSLEPSIFRIFYCTGWDTAVLHYRRKHAAHAPGAPPHSTEVLDWQRTTLLNLPSRGNAMGLWKMAAVVPFAPDEALEFYISNGVPAGTNHSHAGGAREKRGGDVGSGGSSGTKGGSETGRRLEDRPGGRPTYEAPLAGSFKLSRGLVRPFPRGAEARIMLVSDIDGTMIGEGHDPDVFASSARFSDYWENNAALAGSLLVYNTGRSVGSFVDLLKGCEGKLAIPDVLITAVGTKIWQLDDPNGRCNATGLRWVEDMTWVRQLDSGWDLPTVRNVANVLLEHYHDEGIVKMIDDGSEHPHRIALCATLDVLHPITTTLAAAFLQEGLQVRIIVSGSGSHRYVDCVSFHAGKERALQHVRRQHGVAEHLCLAAGDSGNDILMLEGSHPGIVVGNAQAELVHWLVGQPQDNKVIYSDATYADGILEGLARHGLY